jgi:hypothetical protein
MSARNIRVTTSGQPHCASQLFACDPQPSTPRCATRATSSTAIPSESV